MRSRVRLALALGALALAGSAGRGWRAAEPGYRWSFPRDHWSHPGYRNEWWYLTGRLESVDPPGRRLGYQLTFFRVGLLPEAPRLDSRWATANAVMGHAALADLSTGERRFSEVLVREMPDLGAFAAFPAEPIAWSVAPPGTGGRWSLAWNGDGFDLRMADAARGLALSLETRAGRPPALEGPDGYSRKAAGEGAASLYYSFTRLATRGEVTLGGSRWKVAGESWMDHEIGSSQLAPGQVGWDWFGLRLADGRDLMIYQLRRADGAVDFASATVVDRRGPRWLAPGAWSVRATATWRSPATGATYPARWRIEVPGEGLALAVEPELADQENRAAAAGLFYWEGAVRVRDAGGRGAGEGYVELTGYGAGNRPPL